MTHKRTQNNARAAWGYVVLLSLSLLGACGSAPVNSYYTLENTALDRQIPKKTPPKSPVCRAVLAVESVFVEPPYDLTKVVFRPDELEVRYYTHRHWVSSPEEMVRKLLIRRLDAEKLFAVTDSIVFVPESDLTLFAKVHNLEEIDRDGIWNGRLAMSFSLRDDVSGKTEWEYRFDETKPVSKKDVKDIIRTINDIYNRQMDKMIHAMKLALPGIRRCTGRGEDSSDSPD